MSSHLDPRRIDAYLDGELAVAEVAAVESHLSACAACAEVMARQASLFEAIEALPEQAPPSDAVAAIMAIIHNRRARAKALEWLLLPQLLIASALLIYALPSMSSELSSPELLASTLTSLSGAADAFEISLRQAWDAWSAVLSAFADGLADRSMSVERMRQAGSSRLSGIGLAERSPQTWWLVMAAAAACWLIGNGILLHAPSRRPTPGSHK